MNDVTDHPLAVRQEFGVTEQQFSVVETASTAVAAQSKAMVEARYVMALRKPRNWDQVRQDIIRECRRPNFANNKSALYNKPIGKGVEGLGIRFTEVAMRCMTNVLVETNLIFEDDQKEIHRVCVTDLESNITYPLDVRVSKTVERQKPMDDGSYISVRKNSYGKSTYTVPANDDDLLNKRAALISKAQRSLSLRLIPGDIQDEAEEVIRAIRLDKAAADPDAERKRIADAFLDIGVTVQALVAYLGHPIDACSPHELVTLRGIYGAIKDGEATWQTVMENKGEPKVEDQKDTRQPYPAETFAKSLPGWRKLIDTGKKTPDQIIAMVETKNTLTEEQKAAIRGASLSPDSPANAAILAALRANAERATLSEADVCKHLGVEKLDGITCAQAEKASAFISNPMGA